jgi:DNA polymerase-4
VARPRFGRYSELSERFMTILGECTPLVEALSVDEAFMDCTGSVRLLGDGPAIAGILRRRVREELGLAVSVGIGPNKFVAKLATDMNKPDGVTVAPADDPPGALARWLAVQPIERMWGVGPRTVGRFHAAGVRTFGDLQSMPEDRVVATLGDHALAMRERAFGRDDRPVHVEHDRKGVGHETTFAEDLHDPEPVLDALAGLVESACRRLRGAGASTRRVTVKIRTADFETVTRSATLPEATDSTLAVLRSARDLFRRWARASFEPVRLVGVRLEVASGEPTPASLFADPAAERQRAIDSVADRVAERFGPGSITRAPGASTGRPSRPRTRGS